MNESATAAYDEKVYCPYRYRGLASLDSEAILTSSVVLVVESAIVSWGEEFLTVSLEAFSNVNAANPDILSHHCPCYLSHDPLGRSFFHHPSRDPSTTAGCPRSCYHPLDQMEQKGEAYRSLFEHPIACPLEGRQLVRSHLIPGQSRGGHWGLGSGNLRSNKESECNCKREKQYETREN